MQNRTDAMVLAVRVLNAIVEWHYPNAEDVLNLRQLAPEHADRPADELACEVIQRALGR